MGRKKKAAEAPLKRRGQYSPKKADVDAYKMGNLTPLMKRNVTLVDKAAVALKAKHKADARFDGAMLRIMETVSPDGVGRSVTTPDGKLQFRISVDVNVAGNYNAEEAERLIGEYAGELLSKRTASADEKEFGGFLLSIIQRKRGKIKMTPALTEFTKREFEDPRLVEAQKLLRVGFDAVESKPRFYMLILNAENRWVSARWDDAGKRWAEA